jgi:hypothetical protein
MDCLSLVLPAISVLLFTVGDVRWFYGLATPAAGHASCCPLLTLSNIAYI